MPKSLTCNGDAKKIHFQFILAFKAVAEDVFEDGSEVNKLLG